jgi:tetratricopeptide (TPR) repeat protein
MKQHLSIVGAQREQRVRHALAISDAYLVARCHRRLRGPYTGVDTTLEALLPSAFQRWPELVERHRVELLYGMPELAAVIGEPPHTLAGDAPFAQRTRFFGANMIRCMSQGIVTFLLELARQRRLAGDPLPDLIFDEVGDAEVTTQEFLALLLRRADPELIRIVVSGTAAPLLDELADAVVAYTNSVVLPASAERVAAPRSPADVPRLADVARLAELAAAFVDSDGTSDDPDEIEAYAAAAGELRRGWHDRRGDVLAETAGWGSRVGALAFHRERGSDPGEAGRTALLEAQQYCVTVGFSAAVLDLGMRGRAITDPIAYERDFCEFTNQAAAALVPLGRAAEAMELYCDLRQRYVAPKTHMTSSYAIAMLYTRFLQPRDHNMAIQWQHNAIAIAESLPDAVDRIVFGGFQQNALALIEMHRGNLSEALQLVEAALESHRQQLPESEWVLHRSQLRYNRARLLAGLGRLDEAYDEFSALVELDPYYTDYLSERAKVSRLRGDLAAAVADYDRAAELAPPFPELYYNRGTARTDLGDLAGALADFDYVLDMEPGDVDSRLSRADVRLSMGDVDAAEIELAEGLTRQPDEPRLLCMMSAVHLERQQWDAAIAVLDLAISVDPDYPAALVNRAVAHFEAGRPDWAETDLNRALELTGPDPDLLLNRGLCLAAQGRFGEARNDFDRALALPDADRAELVHQRDLVPLALDDQRSASAVSGRTQR